MGKIYGNAVVVHRWVFGVSVLSMGPFLAVSNFKPTALLDKPPSTVSLSNSHQTQARSAANLTVFTSLHHDYKDETTAAHECCLRGPGRYFLGNTDISHFLLYWDPLSQRRSILNFKTKKSIGPSATKTTSHYRPIGADPTPSALGCVPLPSW